MHLYTGKIDGTETIAQVFSEENENNGIKIFWFKYSEYSQFLIGLVFTYFMENTLNVKKKYYPLQSTHAI